MKIIRVFVLKKQRVWSFLIKEKGGDKSRRPMQQRLAAKRITEEKE